MPPMLYYSKNTPTYLQAIHEMQIRLDESKYEDNYFNLQMIKSKPVNNIKICNVELQEECQALSGKVIESYPKF
jgi:hypothetical protein